MRVHPDFVARFFPPLAKGGSGGVHSSGREGDVPTPCLQARNPPEPPLRKGGKGMGRSRRRSIARNKNSRLESVSPVRSTPTFHQPTLRAVPATVPDPFFIA